MKVYELSILKSYFYALPSLPMCVQVELATGEFPYKNCTNDFEVLARVLSEDPPRLPLKRGFSVDFHSFISCW